ncbi:MAG: trehalose-6-phosphate synthase, partial [Actinomyces sp.]
MILASNRGPLSFREVDGELVARRGAGGLVSGLAPLVAGTDTVWFAAALSEADRRAAREGRDTGAGLRVRLLEIDPTVQRLAYDTVCNATLWFLHHGLHDRARRPVFDRHWRRAWAAYRRFNEVFADAIAGAAPRGATVLVQDYHLALLGGLLADERPDLTCVHFSHTPFMTADAVRLLPDGDAHELLSGLGRHAACGFHSPRWEADFLACCDAVLGHRPATFVAPLAPDPDDLAAVAEGDACAAALADIDADLGGRALVVRVDRIELSKNVLRGFRAVDAVCEDRPDLRGRFVFWSIGYPSREGLPEYLAYRQEVEALAAAVNRRWGDGEWTPIRLDLGDDFPRSVAALRRYDVLVVNPIRDGLNLVALEGPLVNDNDGLVVCSREAGVWDLLEGAAIGVNPYDVAAQAEAIAAALDAPPA